MRQSNIALAAAALALCSASVAQAQDKPCLTAPEVETVAGFVLPSTIESLGRKCSPALPAAAYLRSSATSLAARYRSENRVGWAQAQPVIAKIAGESLPAGLDGEFGATLMETGVVAALVEQVPTRDCATADRIVETLAPLPATNMARLVGMLLELGSKQEGAAEKAPFRLCPAAPR